MKKVLGFSGFSESGKTTLIEKIIFLLKRHGYRVAVIKHDGHDFEMDHEGKDTARFASAGADTVMVTSAVKTAKLDAVGKNLFDMIDEIEGVDLILVEGFKNADIPQIGISSVRTEWQLPKSPKEYLAVATDNAGLYVEYNKPVFDLSDAEGLSEFIIERLNDGSIDTCEKDAKDVGVAILTGGKSSRMGSPKDQVVIPWDGRTMLDRICDEMKFFKHRYISVREGQNPGRNDYGAVEDYFKDIGPIGGIFSLLASCKTDALLILTCDMPCYMKSNAEKILNAYQGEELLLLKSPGGNEPLASIYSKKLLPKILKLIEEKNYRLNSILDISENIKVLEDEESKAYRNVNRMDDFEK